jgi:hypothetical protein
MESVTIILDYAEGRISGIKDKLLHSESNKEKKKSMKTTLKNSEME